MSIYIDKITKVLKEAGDKILEIYKDEEAFKEVDFKADDSPLTKADVESNAIIMDFLTKEFDFPIISEEKKVADYQERKEYKSFWLVDPLDGTKEFINRNGEFTVNIALIKNGIPVFGGIYVPVTDTYYFGEEGVGAYKKVGDGALTPIQVNSNTSDWKAVGSKSHAKPEEQEFYSKIGVKDVISVGSSLKFCMVAEGVADLYFRAGPTMEWDIAAGHAIVIGAGGQVYKDLECKEVFSYNKENLLNGSFLCTSTAKLN